MHNMSPLRSTTVALDPHFTTSPGLSQPLSTTLSWCSVCQFTLYWGHFVIGNFLKCPMAVLHRGPAPHCNYSICLHSAFSTSHTHLSLSLSFLRYLPLIPRTVFPPSFLISFSLYSFLFRIKRMDTIYYRGWVQPCRRGAGLRQMGVSGCDSPHRGSVMSVRRKGFFLTHPSLWLVFHPLRLAIGDPCAPVQVSGGAVVRSSRLFDRLGGRK